MHKIDVCLILKGNAVYLHTKEPKLNDDNDDY